MTQMVGRYKTSSGVFSRVWTYVDATELASITSEVISGFAYHTAAFIDPDLQYMSGGVLTSRTVLEDNEFVIIADGGATADGKVEFAMPSGTVVFSHFHGTTQTSGAENFTFQSLRPGVYRFDLTPPNAYVPVQLEITVNAV